MDPIAFYIGPFMVTWYAIFIVTGLLIGTNIGIREGKKHNISEEELTDFIFWMIIFGFIGARTWYVLFDLELYLESFLDIFKIWEGGLAIHGGLLGGALYLLYYTKKHNKNPLIYTDIAAPSLLIGQALGRWGNFMNSEAHGGETTEEFLSNTMHLPEFIVNGMYIDGVYYQPTFLYESIWNLIGFGIIMLIIRKKYRYDYGIITAFYLMWYGFIRFFIEMMRTDALLFGPIKVAQLASVIMMVIGLLIILKKRRTNEKNRN